MTSSDLSSDIASLPLSRLPGLLEKLHEALASFFDAKIALLLKEVWEQAEALLKRGVGIGVGVLLAFLGFMALTAVLVLKVNEAVNNPALACLIVGVAYFVVGAGTTWVMVKKSRVPLEKTRAALEEEAQWIKTQVSPR